ncbi:TPA: hypothetical protein ACXIH6_003164 [Proteus mirabilis]|uniref:hypothetical protein n=1 Tax=Proteus mirabilis TaxID=584 RepID=UPI001058A44D|nr:hypothetical protein [Proteus mirabilis]MBG2746654.1 hypothetical protein [Proteus mirabilis]MBG2835060.1 hypothetical protein [Proteus mirabilis]MBG2887032.1 hypothetical protein [Proteus mirabilis]HAT5556588.1 hypothetical protein [Proteus mirabilis]HBC6376274.1 hypothetical protein [Proteus mirabilis]
MTRALAVALCNDVIVENINQETGEINTTRSIEMLTSKKQNISVVLFRFFNSERKYAYPSYG